jgi:predicted nucleic acid-binding protein
VRFWDTSAVVPLVVEQAGSSEAESWLAADGEVVTWTLTLVEVISALRRLVREGSLDEAAAVQAEDVATELLRRTHVVGDVEATKPAAVRLLRVHALRAADALQLAAALAWTDGAPSNQVLHTLDRRLGLAAQREGFRVIPDPA